MTNAKRCSTASANWSSNRSRVPAVTASFSARKPPEKELAEVSKKIRDDPRAGSRSR